MAGADLPDFQLPAGSYNPVNKRVVYVGGVADEVTTKILNAAFIPFGDIVDITMPIDYQTEKHRGFGFIEFESAEDAAAAIDNMNDSELYGRTLRVNVARPVRIREGWGRPVWSEDNWLKKYGGGGMNKSATMDESAGDEAAGTEKSTEKRPNDGDTEGEATAAKRAAIQATGENSCLVATALLVE